MPINSFFRPLSVCAAVVATIAAFGASPAVAGGISAGTLIQNTATATYTDGGVPQTVTSNTVTVRVDELLDVAVTSLDSGPLTGGPGDAVLTFEVTNLGNGPEAFELVANTNIAGNDFIANVNGIAIDSNGNGVYDPGVDQILASPETTPVLAADETLTVFVLVDVPITATDQDRSDVELTASAATGSGSPGTVFTGQGDGGGDAIVGTTTASATAIGTLLAAVTSVDLVKAVTLVDPFGAANAVPGSIATFTLTATVTGSGSVEDLIVTDAIPDDTTYSPGSLRLDSAPLTDASGDDTGEASDTGGITVNLGTVTNGTIHTITFDVIID